MAEAEIKAVATANNLFSSDMLAFMRQAYPGNFICSPFSLSAALGMVKIGARGTTSKEIKTAMHYPEDCILTKGFCKILTALQEKNEYYTLQATNRLFLNKEYALQESYAKSVTDDFKAPVESLDFSQTEAAALRINSWVEDMTEKKIKNIICPKMLTPDTEMVLVNTLYFLGEWREKFNREATRREDFFLSDSSTVKVEMMKMSSKETLYGKFPEMDAHAIALFYKTYNEETDYETDEDDLVMIIIAPIAKTGVDKIEENLKNYPPERLVGEFLEWKEVDVRMPRFKFTCDIDCIPILKKLGVSDLFDRNSSDLSGISTTDDKLYVDAIIQKAFIEVDEKGTEVAAATVVRMKAGSSGCKTITIRFDADRPFIFQLVDRKRNIILFTGRCSNPAMNQS